MRVPRLVTRVRIDDAGHRDDIVESDWFASRLPGGIRWALGTERG